MDECTKTMKKKLNWSAPGPDRITNYWWKKATCLHQGKAACFEAIGDGEEDLMQNGLQKGRQPYYLNQESFAVRT